MPHRFPDKRLATLYAQPLEVALAAIVLLAGIYISLEPLATPASIAEMEWPWTILFRLLMVIGGTLTLIGALPRRRWSRAFEMLGVIALGTVFGTYAGALFDDGNERAALAMWTYAVLMAGCYVKAYALYLESKSKLAEIRRLPRPQQETN